VRASGHHPRIAGIAAYRVTFRVGSHVERDGHDDLVAALAALERRLRSLGDELRRPTRSAFGREYEPAAQVAARAEIAGRGVRAGVDVRGDGSTEAWTGRLRRSVVAPGPGEDAYAALRRALL
jgi:hypothetical protein